MRKLAVCLLFLTQPRSQGLSSPHLKGSEGRKTLVQAGNVTSKKVGGAKKTAEGRRNQVAILSFLLTMEGENLS